MSPQLTVASQMDRKAKALQVFQLMAVGRTKEDALTLVGITEDVFLRWIGESDETIEAVRSMAAMLQKQQLVQVLSAQSTILSQVIADAMNGATEPKDRLSIAKWLHDLAAELQHEHGAQGQQDEDAASKYLLKGPALRPGASRLRSGPMINIAPREDGSVDITTYQPTPVIDITPSSEETEE